MKKEYTIIKWFKEEKTNIILALLPVALTLFVGFIQYLGKSENAFAVFCDSKFINILQVICIVLTLGVLLNNRNQIRKGLVFNKQRLLMYLRRECNMRDEGSNSLDAAYWVVKETVRQFYYIWIIIWGLWLFYYCGNLIWEIGLEKRDTFDVMKWQYAYNAIFDLATSTLIYVLYIILNNVTVQRNQRNPLSNGLRYDLILLVVIVSCIFSLIICSIAADEKEKYWELQLIISSILGIFSTIVLVMTLGKLNSNYLQIPRILFYTLYLYAIIQIYEPVLMLKDFSIQTNDSKIGGMSNVIEILQISFSYFTLIGKICLSLALTWIVYEYRLVFFVIHKSLSLTENAERLQNFTRYVK